MSATLMLLAALQAANPAQEELLATARAALAGIVDTADARAAGFVPFEFHDQIDRSPFQGEHWILEADTPWRTELDAPFFVLFAPRDGALRRVGSAYMVRLEPHQAPPATLADVPARWHTHAWCSDVPGEGRALAHDTADCESRGGRPQDRQFGMVHVWTDVPSPYGLFAHDNPTLPFLAAGLAPPPPAALADPVRGPELRLLALALAETYGAQLEYARRVERRATDAELRTGIQRRRARLTLLVPLLLEAQRRGDRPGQATLRAAMLRQGRALYELYERAAPTEALRREVVREYEEALGAAHDVEHASSSDSAHAH